MSDTDNQQAQQEEQKPAEDLTPLTRLEQRNRAIEQSKQYYSTPEQVREIYQRLTTSYAKHTTKPYEYRMNQLKAFKKMIDEHAKDIIDACAADLHKLDAVAYMTEIGMVKADLAEAMAQLKVWMKPTKVATPLVHAKGLSSSYILPEPLGTVLIVSPWNYPCCLSLQPLIGAISAGCCAIVKPSSLTCTV